MKFRQKINRFFVKPPERRGFSRIDLVVLLLLGLIVVANFLIHAVLSPTHVSAAGPTVSAHVSQAREQPAKSAMPDIPSSHQYASSSSAQINGPLGANDQFFFFTTPDLTVNQGNVKTLQGWALAAVDVFIVLVLILAGVRVMLGGSIFRHANVIETLPGILLALLAANLSMGIVTYSLQLNNALSQDFYNYSKNVSIVPSGLTTGQTTTNTSCNKARGELPPTDPRSCANQPATQTTGGTNWDSVLQDMITPANLNMSLGDLWGVISNPLQFIASVMSLILIGQMVIRIFLIDFYIILGPLGLGCWALPGRGGQSLTRMWLQGFFSALFTQFLQVVALIVIHMLIGAIAAKLYPAYHALPKSDDSTLLWVLVLAEYWLVIRIPSMLGGTATNLMVSFGQTLSQAASTVVALSAAEVQFVSSLVISGVGTIAAVAR